MGVAVGLIYFPALIILTIVAAKLSTKAIDKQRLEDARFQVAPSYFAVGAAASLAVTALISIPCFVFLENGLIAVAVAAMTSLVSPFVFGGAFSESVETSRPKESGNLTSQAVGAYNAVWLPPLAVYMVASLQGAGTPFF